MNNELDEFERYDDWSVEVETFLCQHPGASSVYIADSLRIPLEAVETLVRGIRAERLPSR